MFIKKINRNTSWDTTFSIEVDEPIYLDISMPKDCFVMGFTWWDFQDFVIENFKSNHSLSRMSDGSYDKLVLYGTCDEIAIIFELFLEQKRFKSNSFNMKRLKRYLICYKNIIKERKAVKCLEAYIKDNTDW